MKSKQLFALVSTFNIDDVIKPGRNTVHQWLGGFNHNSIDIYLFGFQESSQFHTEEVEIDLIPEQDPAICDNWTSDILDYVNSCRECKVVVLHSFLFKSIMSIVLIRSDLIEHVNDLHVGKWVTRTKTLSGIKGSTSFKFTIFDKTFMHVVSHMEAHEQEKFYQFRLGEYKQLTTDNGFLNWEGCSGYQTPLFDHDFCFCLGDFNFRIEQPMEDVKEKIENNDFISLLEHDQLLRARREEGLFPGFEEAPINFPPSYKFDVGTINYDTSEKARTPSWTDRILYKGNVQSLYYNYRRDILISDHKPVVGLYVLTL